MKLSLSHLIERHARLAARVQHLDDIGREDLANRVDTSRRRTERARHRRLAEIAEVEEADTGKAAE